LALGRRQSCTNDEEGGAPSSGVGLPSSSSVRPAAR
jgi:hypothetical protein